jgi:hypothetical protein
VGRLATGQAGYLAKAEAHDGLGISRGARIAFFVENIRPGEDG